ncbi:hypothetical protein FH972_008323 [Carpinus fangiana]|uniref:CCHC-type domain-containing protein n=1 Tax=Carpinus fangiana TaxID=176857 RepID=A0A5N6R1E4_9ROSI|nr:hypothetical protein FH972_008323 [Carpinus fangiana]
MVSQRQRLARKRYREANPELFPKPEPTPPKDPDRKKKKTKSKFKRKKAESKAPNDPSKPIRKGFKKHPLRVPGMKPGESCFICKAQDHIAKLCPQKAQWERNKICFLCRQRGHSLKNCPNNDDETVDKKFCYNCGETGHSLAMCRKPIQDGGTKFADCFICNERGHLSKNCPKNTHGIYPKGGGCKICGGITHLAKDCPNKGNQAASGAGNTSIVDDERPRGKVTKFLSGDDLEDDFLTDDTYSANKDKPSESKVGSASDSKESHVKPKKKQGPKIVNFVA